MTIEEARAEFDALCAFGEAWEKFDGDLAALEQQHIKEAIALRRAFARLARHKGLL